jgi:SbsC C-terminal domain/Bacterial pre-peptidase C-terminal domain
VKRIASLSLAGMIIGSTLISGNALAATTSSQNATNQGKQLITQLNEFNRIINSGNIAAINMKYDALSKQIKNTEKAIGKVSGSKNRTNLNNQYVRPAKVARERVIYEVSQFRLLDSIDKKIEFNESKNTLSQLAKLDRLKKRATQIKNAGGYQDLPSEVVEALSEWENDSKNHKNPEKENTAIYIENEPNNSNETATFLPSGAVYKGTVGQKSGGVDDVYKIDVNEPGKVKLLATGGIVFITVTDDQNNEIASGENVTFEASSKGTYYIEVHYGPWSSSNEEESYMLKVTYPSTNNNGSNDLLTLAHPVKSGRTYFETSDSPGDIDLYKIDVKSAGEINVELGNKSSDKSIILYDKFNNELAHYSKYHKDKMSFTVSSADTYYVGVEGTGDGAENNPYRLKISYPSNKKYFNSQFEDNNTPENAMPILTNIQYTTYFESQTDVDIFKVYLKKGTARFEASETGIYEIVSSNNQFISKIYGSSRDVQVPTDGYYSIKTSNSSSTLSFKIKQ